jgi:hypothetical protein
MHLEAQCKHWNSSASVCTWSPKFLDSPPSICKTYFFYVQITAGRFCAHGVDPLSSRDSRGMLDLEDCGGRLSYTLPHNDSILIISFQFPLHQTPSPPPVQFWHSFRSLLLPSSLTSTVTSVYSEFTVRAAASSSTVSYLTRRLSFTILVSKLNVALPSTYREVQQFFLCILRTQYFENKGRP